MAESEKNKAGLQKKVSSVFKGVPLPQNSGVQQTPRTPASDATPGASAQPPSVNHQPAQSSLLKKLQQAENASDNAQPGATPAASPKPAPPQRQQWQPSGNKKQAQPHASPKEQALFTKRPQKHSAEKVAGPSLWRHINDRLFPPKPGVSPARQKAMVLLIPVLAIIMIFMFRQVLSTSPRQTQAGEEDLPIVSTARSSHQVDWKIPDPLPAIERDPAKLADQPVSTTTEPNETVATTAADVIDIRDIIYSKDKPSALINAQIVYVGHKVGSATVVQILKDGVEFERDGKRWIQKIGD